MLVVAATGPFVIVTAVLVAAAKETVGDGAEESA